MYCFCSICNFNIHLLFFFLKSIVTKQKIFLEFGEFTLDSNGEKTGAPLDATFKYSQKDNFAPLKAETY